MHFSKEWCIFVPEECAVRALLIVLRCKDTIQGNGVVPFWHCLAQFGTIWHSWEVSDRIIYTLYISIEAYRHKNLSVAFGKKYTPPIAFGNNALGGCRNGQYHPVILTGDLCLRSPHAKIISPPLRSVDYFLWGPRFSRKCIFFASDINTDAKIRYGGMALSRSGTIRPVYATKRSSRVMLSCTMPAYSFCFKPKEVMKTRCGILRLGRRSDNTCRRSRSTKSYPLSIAY